MLYKFFAEDNTLFRENFGAIIYNTIISNKVTFSEVLHKWFEKDWEEIVPIKFIDFIYTITDSPINKYEDSGEDLIFEDGSVLKILDNIKSWSNDVFDQYFVPSDNYKEVLEDISTLEKLFKL